MQGYTTPRGPPTYAPQPGAPRTFAPPPGAPPMVPPGRGPGRPAFAPPPGTMAPPPPRPAAMMAPAVPAGAQPLAPRAPAFGAPQTIGGPPSAPAFAPPPRPPTFAAPATAQPPAPAAPLRATFQPASTAFQPAAAPQVPAMAAAPPSFAPPPPPQSAAPPTAAFGQMRLSAPPTAGPTAGGMVGGAAAPPMMMMMNNSPGGGPAPGGGYGQPVPQTKKAAFMAVAPPESAGGGMGVAPGGGGGGQKEAAIDFSSQCDPRFMRCTMSKFGNCAQTQSAAKVPFGVVCQPMALDGKEGEKSLEVVNFGSTGIVRCKKCRAYINPFVSWVNNGRQWRCNVCGFVNDVPNSYFCQLDPETGQRRDRDQRPELRDGSVEMVAPGEYMVRPPQPPVYVFVVDVSAAAVANGSVAVVARSILEALDALPGAPRTQFALITYDAAVHFYSLKSTLSTPQMLCVADLADFFVPLPDDLLVNLSESRAQIEALLEALPAMHGGGGGGGGASDLPSKQASLRPESCLGTALTAAYRVMGHVGGKLCVFAAAMPSVGEAPLKPQRENPRAYGSEHERALILPEGAPEPSWYETKAIEFSRLQIGVELFVTAASYVDLATMAALPRVTAGQLYYYPAFTAARDGAKLAAELGNALTRPTGFEAVMRVRCTRGLKCTAFRGNYYVRGHDLLALPNCTPDSAFALELAHDEPPLTASVASIQASLLYTTSSGERRIRVHTLVAPVSSSVSDLVNSADVDVVVNLLAKASVDVAFKQGLEAARSKLQSRCVEIVAACRSDRRQASHLGAIGGYAAASRAGGPAGGGYVPGAAGARMMMGGGGPGGGSGAGPPGSSGAQLPAEAEPPKLPDSLQLLPLYTMSLLKCAAFRGGQDVRADERSFILQRLDNMAPDESRYFVYPRLFAIHALPADAGTRPAPGAPVALPPPCNLSSESISTEGIFLLDNALQLFVWLGAATPAHVAEPLFTVAADGDLAIKPADADPTSAVSRFNAIIDELRAQHAAHLAINIVREGDPHKQPVFFRHLVEDHAAFNGGQFSYSEFMAHVQRNS